ncbi:MAG: HlyD family secretion protein [Verrucomicrobiota bacterium]|jgi:multidrug efflux pump subunit AcrA (membrane-fusion protein)
MPETHRFPKLFFALLAILLAAGAVIAADAKPAPATHTVAKGTLKAKVQLDAVFESVDMTPVKIETKTWTDLTVLEAVPHGARVKKGERLVKIDTEKLLEQIKEQEQDAPGTVIALETAVAELANLEETTPLKLDAAKRTGRVATEELAYFESTGRAQREKNSRFNLKSAEQRLEGAREELKQLEKMYKADDLTEETEEIILKRQKFTVEASEISLESTKLMVDRDFKTLIPREHETLKATKKDQDFALSLSQLALPKTLAKKRLDLDKLKRDQKKADKKFADLKKDLENLSVISPADGIVYYGACENGKWTSGGIVAKKLVPTGKLSANEVFMTIVNPARMQLRAVATEADLANLKSGSHGTASPVSAPDKKFPVKLDELGTLPLPGGGFEARLSFEKDSTLHLMPGMNAKVAIGESGRGEVLLVPKDSIVTEGKKSFVYLSKEGTKSEKHAIKTGENDGKMIEILDGLSEGDKILATRPD